MTLSFSLPHPTSTIVKIFWEVSTLIFSSRDEIVVKRIFQPHFALFCIIFKLYFTLQELFYWSTLFLKINEMKGEINEVKETFRNFITNFPSNNLPFSEQYENYTCIR